MHKEQLQYGAHKLGSLRSHDPWFTVSRQRCSVSYITKGAAQPHFTLFFCLMSGKITRTEIQCETGTFVDGVCEYYPPITDERVAPLHLAPGSPTTTTTSGDTPESQFMVLVKGASAEHAETGPLVWKCSEGWRKVREIDQSGLWEVQGWKHLTLAELEKGLHELQGGKVRVLPPHPRQDIPSLQTLPPPPGLGPELLPLGQPTFLSLGKRIALAQGPALLPVPAQKSQPWGPVPRT